MNKFILAYFPTKKPASPEEGKAAMQRWKQWIEEKSPHIINPGTPIGPTTIVSSEGSSPNNTTTKLQGFTTIQAKSLEEAIEIAESCPFTEMGNIHVGKIMKM